MDARFSSADYAAAFRALMPRGRVWPDDAASVQSQAVGGLVGSFERLDASAVGLIADAFPASTDQLLPEWEASLGLPDICAGDDQTQAQRKAQVIARFASAGGQSREHYRAYAAALGFGIEITAYAPFRVDMNTCGQPLYGEAWAYAWGVTVIRNTGGLDPAVLLCELNAIKPAETVLLLLS